MDFELIAKKFRMRFKFNILYKYFNESDEINVLDIGAGNKSASVFKKYFPNSHYTGIDKSRDYNQTEEDYKCMDYFLLMDLDKDDIKKKLNTVQNNTYDIIILSHIIEHLHNGDKLLDALANYLLPNGIIYVEWPREKSVLLKKDKYKTLNFYDDETHIRIYPLYEVCNILRSRGLIFESGGVRRHIKEILCIPFIAMYSIIFRGRVSGSVFWDLKGFANYVVFRKAKEEI